MIDPVVVMLTARRGSGKDTIADYAIDKLNCQTKFAQAEILKQSAMKVFGLSADNVSGGKDTPFETPLTLDVKQLRKMITELGDLGCAGYRQIPSSKWLHRCFNTPRQLLVWYAEDILKKYLGEAFFIKHLLKTIDKYERDNSRNNIIFVTDVRFYELEALTLTAQYSKVYPIKVIRNDIEKLDLRSENSIDVFPDDFFYATIENNGSLDDLYTKVDGIISNILFETDHKAFADTIEKIRHPAVVAFAPKSEPSPLAALIKKDELGNIVVDNKSNLSVDEINKKLETEADLKALAVSTTESKVDGVVAINQKPRKRRGKKEAPVVKDDLTTAV